MATSISYNGNSLQTSSIITSDIDLSGMTKDLKMYALSHADASSIPYYGYPSQTIKVSGTLIASSVTGLDALLDTFKGYLVGQDKNLDIDWNGSTRRFTATPQFPKITRPNNLGYAKFQIDFVCTNPFGQDTSSTTALTATSRTLGSYSDVYTFLGTAEYQVPVITITYTAVSGATNQYVQFGNANTGQSIVITRTWANSDVLVIDCAQKTVTVNGTSVNFTGAFPEFPPGSQTMQYNDGFTTRTFNITVTYTTRYL